MIDVQEQFKRQAKIAARKQHYFAIAQMLHSQMEVSKKVAVAGQSIIQARQEDEESVPEGMVRTAAQEMILVLTPIYQVCISLRFYRDAFGEYPEWVRFIHDGKGSEEHLNGWMKTVMDLYQEASKKLGRGADGRAITDIVFGEAFQKICERVKVKGEV